jgi:excinuclease ABC subunit C
MQKGKTKDKVKELPKSPGVYVFYGAKREILYVGKATSLRDRVRSYFSPSPQSSPRGREGYFSRPVETAIEQIADIKIIRTDTVLEAFILEQNLIKKLQPKYNAMGKDDKSFCYVVMTKEEFPRFMIVRKTDIDKISNSPNYLIPNKLPNPKSPKASRIFGPYTSKKNIEIVLKLLKRIFPYHSSAQKTEKGCLDFELGRCPGPYAGAITRAGYLKNIRGIRMILEGKKKGLVKKLEKEMKSYSKNHEYEKAAESRNKLFALKHINDIALISQGDEKFQIPNSKFQNFRIEAYDISNISGQFAVGSMVVFNDDGPDKAEYRKFKIRTIRDSDDVGMMREVLIRRFNNNWPKPNLILLDGGIGHLHMTERLLNNLKLSIPLVAVAKGPTRKISNFQFLISKQIQNPKSKNLVNDLLNDKNLIKQIMDEAHRFAITYHRKVRKREFIKI